MSSIDSAISNALAFKQAVVQNKIDIEVAKQAMDAQEMQGQMVVEMLQQVAQLSQALAAGGGGHIDVQV